MKVLMLGAEAVPFAKVGGLADVLGALIPTLREKYIDIRLFMPLYKSIKEGDIKLKKVMELDDINMGDKSYKAFIYETLEPYPAYFVDGELFDRPGVYTDPETGQGYPDEPYRYIFFLKAVAKALPEIGFKPDVYHLNDSHTALWSAFLRLNLNNHPFYKDAHTLFTIHNIAYQGIWSPDIIQALGFGSDQFYPTGPFEFYNKVNFLKVGIVYSDAVSTVSPTYAKEITESEEYGYGMEGLLRQKKDRLFGILNGVDYSAWNPEKDKFIPHNYTSDNLESKEQNKIALLEQFGLPASDKSKPLFGVVTRLAVQKGIELIYDIAPKIFEKGGNLVILGTGEKKYHELLSELAKKYPKNFMLALKFDNATAHLIEAGSDFFLMPSLYEPCGLNQMYSLKYGTLPIVRKTGGLADTIVDYTENPSSGNGFQFLEFTSDALLSAIERAFKLYSTKSEFTKVVKRAMNQDFGWEKSANEYIDLYSKIRSM